jgi:hypothetical protein
VTAEFDNTPGCVPAATTTHQRILDECYWHISPVGDLIDSYGLPLRE